jgi:hypothetical protein
MFNNFYFVKITIFSWTAAIHRKHQEESGGIKNREGLTYLFCQHKKQSRNFRTMKI